MPASNKVGTQLLVSPHLRDRARALAIVRHESVAEVWRAALEGFGLPGLERQHAEDLARLSAAIKVGGKDRRRTLGSVMRGRTDLEALETEDRATLLEMGIAIPESESASVALLEIQERDADDAPESTRPTDAGDEAA